MKHMRSIEANKGYNMQVSVGDLVLRHGTSGAKYLGLVTQIMLTTHGSSYIVAWNSLPNYLDGPYNENLTVNFRWNYLEFRKELKL